MRVKDKLFMEQAGLIEHGPITIVAFGDSVTHGALRDTINYETVYWNRLRKKLLEVRNYVPVNVICAGIGGMAASNSIERMDKQVLAHNPDLIIICFGLNDVSGMLEDYKGALAIMFEKALKSGAEVIFMTPNMMNTYVADDVIEGYDAMAARMAEYQKEGGKMDEFMTSATALAEKMGVTVCDCYAKWKELSKNQDVTLLLDNRINHPVAEMHELFADSLFEIIMK